MTKPPMGPADLDALLEGYMRYNRYLCSPEFDAGRDDPDEAAYGAVEEAIWRGPAAEAWALVVELLRRAPDDELGNLAAGPLENLVSERGAELVDEIEAEAARDARFRWALGCIWLSEGLLPDTVLDRVVIASGGEIRPLPPIREVGSEPPLPTCHGTSP